MLTLIHPCPLQGDLFCLRAVKRLQAARAYYSAVPLDRYVRFWLRHAECIALDDIFAHAGPVVVLGVPDIDYDEWIPGLTPAHVEAVSHGVYPVAVGFQVSWVDPWLELGSPVVVPEGSALEEAGYGGPVTAMESGLLLGPARAPRGVLSGQRLVVTRAEEAGFELAEALEQHGASVVSFPVLAFEALSPEPLEQALQSSWDWVVFTSANGVRFFCELARDVRKLKNARIAAIGPATAQALRNVFLEADLVPPKYVAESLLEVFPAAGKVLICRAEEARDVLPEGLRERGTFVEVVPVYRTVVPADVPVLEDADRVLFTSSSTVKHFRQLVGEDIDLPVLAIGPVTAATARELGFTEVEEALEHTTTGMVEWLTQRARAR